MDKRAQRQLTLWMIVAVIVIIVLFFVAMNGYDWLLDLNYNHRE